MKDKKRRTILKSITFRIVATIATVVIVYLMTGKYDRADRFGIKITHLLPPRTILGGGFLG